MCASKAVVAGAGVKWVTDDHHHQQLETHFSFVSQCIRFQRESVSRHHGSESVLQGLRVQSDMRVEHCGAEKWQRQFESERRDLVD